MRLLFLGIISKRIRWCEKDCLTGSIFLPSSWNQSLSKYGLKVPWKSFVNLYLFQFGGINNSSIQVQLEYHQNALEQLVKNVEVHPYFYRTQLFSLSCLQRSFVTTSRHWNLWFLHVRTFSPTQVLNWLPMSRTIRLSFVLIEMTKHGRDCFGDRHCQITSTSGLSMKSNPLFLVPGNDLPCAQGSLVLKKSERSCTSFLCAGSCPSFLVAGGYLSLLVRFAFSWFLKIFEQCITGSDFCVVSVNFIHKTLVLSWYHNTSYVSKSTDWWNRKSQSILVKSFHNMNLSNRSINRSCGDSFEGFSFRIDLRNRTFSAWRSDFSQSVFSIWSNLVAIPCCDKILE